MTTGERTSKAKQAYPLSKGYYTELSGKDLDAG